MFDQSIIYYDFFYTRSGIRNYYEETQQIMEFIEKHKPDARDVLDIACGTGEHAKLLGSKYNLDGIDIDKRFVRIAKQKHKSGRFCCADMIKFDLGKKYDIVMCLFSSIGYIKTIADLVSTLVCFKGHLNEKGWIILEPWLTPEHWKGGRIDLHTAESDRLKICRVGVSSRRGKISILNYEFLVAKKGKIYHFSEYHEMRLFTKDEMQRAFQKAGLEAYYMDGGFRGRGLYVAKRSS